LLKKADHPKFGKDVARKQQAFLILKTEHSSFNITFFSILPLIVLASN